MMKIKAINSPASDVTRQPTIAKSDYLAINSLWQKQVSSLEVALLQLTQADSRHELQIKASDETTLLAWLNGHFDALMAQHAEGTGLGRAVCASLWLKQWAELVFPTLVALRWQYNLVPQLDADKVGLDIENNGRITTISTPPKAFYSEEDTRLDEHFAKMVADLCEPLLPIFAEQKVNRKRFWGNVSNALAQGFTRLVDDQSYTVATDVSASIARWLESVLGDKQNLVEINNLKYGQSNYLYVRRKTCCLKYKLNKVRMCKTCNLKPEDEQRDFYRDKFAAHSG